MWNSCLILCSLYFLVVSAKPFLYGSTSSLTSIASTASASASQPPGNIADLRKRKLALLQNEKIIDDTTDDFNIEQDQNEAAPSLLQKKINKILTKLRFLSQFTNPEHNNKDDDDFDKEIDDFEKEYEMDVKNSTEKQNLQDAGYLYNVPKRAFYNLERSAKQIDERTGVEPSSLGIFFLELIGSFLGLVYGAGVQLTNPSTPAI